MSEKDIIFVFIVILAYAWASHFEPKWILIK